ncbi:hypothetical protein LTR10_023428 [Elasticomyces elasticus]|uniref:NTF2-like domain-containing protein n=1 Tax=Exophiala sideris TaxID=1016849 RepID=A0ABR0J7K4_9EURO|nr:hypothetical protein LTR10_023428 [Elasticomyces elasticus]KAK5028288.1 hypothetical protein LTS07_006379 [Exophiala sideris]KAK5036067.1 hypothetical protein LTR13_005637 [Exophiala sideris]KAK5057104.1 hypothetical protein LTR69_007742 [Exophiala sideris]KAK5181511.1 hypothetical protein LTR44_006306 [Eurotiomycetes sp. CCFEE 6388]
MKFSAVLACAGLLTGSAQAWTCLSQADANNIAAQSTIFLQHLNVTEANATAQALFADGIVEYGDSINSLRGAPLGTQVENGKATYINDTLSTPPIPTINTLAVVAGCNQMVWQWEFLGIGTGANRVRGMTLITVDSGSKIVEQYVEFNSLAWGADIGFNITATAIP